MKKFTLFVAASALALGCYGQKPADAPKAQAKSEDYSALPRTHQADLPPMPKEVAKGPAPATDTQAAPAGPDAAPAPLPTLVSDVPDGWAPLPNAQPDVLLGILGSEKLDAKVFALVSDETGTVLEQTDRAGAYFVEHQGVTVDKAVPLGTACATLNIGGNAAIGKLGVCRLATQTKSVDVLYIGVWPEAGKDQAGKDYETILRTSELR